MLRILRFAATLVFAALGVITLWLWLRSYWSWDMAWLEWGPVCTGFESGQGCILLYQNNEYMKANYGVATNPIAAQSELLFAMSPFSMISDRSGTTLIAPHWFVVQLFAVLAFLPWLSWRRFTVQRLLVASTYLAVLCALVALSRAS
jgi:hypothetical protein